MLINKSNSVTASSSDWDKLEWAVSLFRLILMKFDQEDKWAGAWGHVSLIGSILPVKQEADWFQWAGTPALLLLIPHPQSCLFPN